jgi:hypothetical protein
MKRYVGAVAGLALVTGWLLWSAGSAAQDEPKGWGTIKGHVVYGGQKIPEPVKLNVNKDKEHCLAKGDLFGEAWVVNKKNMGVQDVFIWIEGEEGTAPPINPKLREIKDKTVTMDQPRCQFVPHALAMRQGQVLLVKNSAPIPHNFKWGGHPLVNPGGNRLMPPGSKFEIKDLKADKLPISVACNIHPWMSAWIRVFDHPYYALTDKDGAFEIKLAPAGNYHLKVWHPASGWMGGAKGRMGMPITIQAGKATELGQLKVQARGK